VVQYARKQGDKQLCLFAIKFFADKRDFDVEVHMLRTSPLRHFMPNVLKFESNEDCRITDPCGRPMPPFKVMAKGVSLRERAPKCSEDVCTAAQVRFPLDGI
jgi:hypothetical protein